jgi:hypothetical protein
MNDNDYDYDYDEDYDEDTATLPELIDRYHDHLLVLLAARAGTDVSSDDRRAAVVGALSAMSSIIETFFSELPLIIRDGYRAWGPDQFEERPDLG